VVTSEEDNEDVFPNTNLVATKWKRHKLLTWWSPCGDMIDFKPGGHLMETSQIIDFVVIK
jgi:hypothetical protein